MTGAPSPEQRQRTGCMEIWWGAGEGQKTFHGPPHDLFALLLAAFLTNLRSQVLVLTDAHWLCDVGQVTSLL